MDISCICYAIAGHTSSKAQVGGSKVRSPVGWDAQPHVPAKQGVISRRRYVLSEAYVPLAYHEKSFLSRFLLKGKGRFLFPRIFIMKWFQWDVIIYLNISGVGIFFIRYNCQCG